MSLIFVTDKQQTPQEDNTSPVIIDVRQSSEVGSSSSSSSSNSLASIPTIAVTPSPSDVGLTPTQAAYTEPWVTAPPWLTGSTQPDPRLADQSADKAGRKRNIDDYSDGGEGEENYDYPEDTEDREEEEGDED